MADEYEALMRELAMLETSPSAPDRPTAPSKSQAIVPTSWDEDSIAAAFARESRQKDGPR